MSEDRVMNRAAAVLLIGGVVPLITWAVAPASSVTTGQPAARYSDLNQGSAVIAEVNAQVDRLRERLAAPPEYPPPERDPFRFGRRTEPRRPTPTPEAAPVTDPVAPPPEPALPVLVAIAASASEGGTITRTAIFAEREEVHLLKEGDKIGRFVVRTITATGADLFDSIANRTHRIDLK